MPVLAVHGPQLGVSGTCQAIGLARSTYYRWRQPPRVPRVRQPARALGPAERHAVLEQLHAPRFADLAPAQVYATLLDEGEYLCSERTMYRVLAAEQEVRERRNLLRHPRYAAPELLATAPNQLWSWDITKLLGPTKWTYYYLYVILDVFSRYVVGWLLAYRESAVLAERLIAATCRRQGIPPGQLTVHADRGSSMIWHSCWPISGSPRRIVVRTSPTTTRIPRRSSRPSSTAPPSRSVSARSNTPAPSAAICSTGTTTSIIIRRSDS
jgi:transposase InsO family protein